MSRFSEIVKLLHSHYYLTGEYPGEVRAAPSMVRQLAEEIVEGRRYQAVAIPIVVMGVPVLPDHRCRPGVACAAHVPAAVSKGLA